MITDRYELMVDFGGGYRSVATHFEGFSRTEVCHNQLKAADNSCRLIIKHDVELENLLRGITENGVKAYITKNGSRLFTGYVRRTFAFSNTGTVQDTGIELVSPSFILKRNISSNVRMLGATVTGCVKKLLQLAGYPLAELEGIPSIGKTIPFLCIEADSTTYYDVISNLLWEYGYILEFDNWGLPTAYRMDAEIRETSQTFRTVTDMADGNILEMLKQSVSDEAYQKFSIEWIGIKTLEGVSIFSDTTNATTKAKCVQVVQPRTYYGESEADSEGLYLEYSCENYDLLYAHDVTLDWEGESNLEKKEFTDYGTRGFLKIFNNSYSTAKKITKLDLYGTAIVKEAVNVAKISNSDGIMAQTYSYQSKYIYDKDSADKLCSILASYYKYADFVYELTSRSDYAVGSLAYVEDPQTGSVLCRIIQKSTNEYSGKIQYKLEGVSEYVPAIVVTESRKLTERNESGMVDKLLELQKSVDEIEISNSYTLDLSPEMQGVSCDSEGNIHSVDNVIIKAWLYQYDTVLSGVSFTSNKGTWNGNELSIPVTELIKDTTDIEVYATYGNVNRTAIATITKIYASESSWYQYDMELSDYAVTVDGDGTLSPSEISATKWKRSQEGQEATEIGEIYATVDDKESYILNSYQLDDGSGYNPLYDYKKQMVPQYIALAGEPILVNGVAIVTYRRTITKGDMNARDRS